MKRLLMIFLFLYTATLYSQNLVIIIIDGARYSETFGDETFSNIPNMKALSSQGTYLENFYNEHDTWTSSAIPALWTGCWAGSYNLIYNGNETQATYFPSIFEYFRKQKDIESSKCFYTLKYVSSLWLQSFHQDYGEEYWPTTISSGNNDNDVLATTIEVMETHHPQLLWVYLADVDSEGHSGIWENYISSIQNADEIVNTIWNKIQSDSFYQDNTTLLVTNDHGRHDDSHGGFTGHGCSCDGCQHIMFFAIGKNIKENYISTTPHELSDFAVTASNILEINPEYSTGEVISEIFKTLDIQTIEEDFNIIISNNTINLQSKKQILITLEIYDICGNKVEILADNQSILNHSTFKLSTNYKTGIYLLKLKYENNSIIKKFFVF